MFWQIRNVSMYLYIRLLFWMIGYKVTKNQDNALCWRINGANDKSVKSVISFIIKNF